MKNKKKKKNFSSAIIINKEAIYMFIYFTFIYIFIRNFLKISWKIEIKL